MIQVARRLGVDQTFAKGIIVGLGITLHEIGTALAITEADFDRLKQYLSETSYPMGNRSRRQPGAAVT